MRERAVIHLNVADFAVAVERAVDSGLRGRPVIVAPQGAARAAVYDMSEEAFRHGVRKGMALGRAQRLCRDARLLAPHPHRYERAMRALLRRAQPYSPLIEAVDERGHLFLDVTGTGKLFGPPSDVAWRIRREVREHLRLDPIWTLASNRLVAKVASRVVKPTGEWVVAAGEETKFLQPLPLHLLPGLEHDDLQRLAAFHLRRVGELAAWSRAQLTLAFGRQASPWYDLARGEDSTPVLPIGRKRPVARAEYEFGDDTNDREVLEGALYSLVEQVGAELRQRRLTAPRIAVTLDYSDGVRCCRQAGTATPTANDLRLFALAGQALQWAWQRRVRVRHLQVCCDRLQDPPAQMELFAPAVCQSEKPDQLVAAIDQIRQRFGAQYIRLGRTMQVGSGPSTVHFKAGGGETRT